jgi:hypothetical protein
MTCRPGLHTCGALGIALFDMDLAAQMAADCEERMMNEELVERVARVLCHDGQGLCVGFCHEQRCRAATEAFGDAARAVIPIIAAHEREQCARLIRDSAPDWVDEIAAAYINPQPHIVEARKSGINRALIRAHDTIRARGDA